MTVLLPFSPPVIGHRGACAYAPENTMSSFTKALLLGVHWVEFDVMLASCGTPIVFHDETLDRTTDGHGDVGIYSYTYLQTLDAGAWFAPWFAGERIPTLDEVMVFLRETGMGANVEIKPLPNQDEQTVLNAVEVIQRHFPQPHPSILFSSFSVEALRVLRAKLPECYLGLLMHEWLPDWEKISDSLDCVSLHLNHEILTRESALRIKNKDKLLLCYTVNDPDRARELYSWGVDAVFSDKPDEIMG